MKERLTIHFKPMGRSYVYTGQDLTNSPWYIKDADGVRYEDQNEYQEVQDKKKAAAEKKVVVKKKGSVNNSKPTDKE